MPTPPSETSRWRSGTCPARIREPKQTQTSQNSSANFVVLMDAHPARLPLRNLQHTARGARCQLPLGATPRPQPTARTEDVDLHHHYLVVGVQANKLKPMYITKVQKADFVTSILPKPLYLASIERIRQGPDALSAQVKQTRNCPNRPNSALLSPTACPAQSIASSRASTPPMQKFYYCTYMTYM